MPFGNLPYIIDGNVKLSETMAVMGYIANKWKPEVIGRTPQAKAECYRMQCICADKFFAFMKLAFAQPNLQPIIDACMKNAEEIVAYLGNKKFLIGDEVCVADFVFFEHVNYMIHLNSTSAAKTPEKVWARYPTLEGYHSRMSNLPGLKEFIAREADSVI